MFSKLRVKVIFLILTLILIAHEQLRIAMLIASKVQHMHVQRIDKPRILWKMNPAVTVIIVSVNRHTWRY